MGTGPLQCLVSSGGWPRGDVHSTHTPPMVLPSLARETQHPCLLFQPLSAVQHRDHFSTFSFWHKQDVLLACKCPCRNYTVGLIVYISSTLNESEIYSVIAFIMILWVCHIITADIAFCFAFIYFIFIMIFFLSTPDTALTPPGNFNSTITQHNTISAEASAGRIKVTWAAPDCNQSKSNECRTKAGIITLAGVTFLSLLGFFFFFCSLSVFFFSLWVSRNTNK